MNKEKPKVGQIIYSLNIGNSYRASWGNTQKLTEYEVSRVGRKYFYIVQTCIEYRDNNHKRGYEICFEVTTWAQKTEYCADHKLYETALEWEEENESDQIHKLITLHFKLPNRHHNTKAVPLEKLRLIKEILEGEA